jgi:hypothetical protein
MNSTEDVGWDTEHYRQFIKGLRILYYLSECRGLVVKALDWQHYDCGFEAERRLSEENFVLKIYFASQFIRKFQKHSISKNSVV